MSAEDFWMKKDPISSYKSKMIENNQFNKQEIIEKIEIISAEINEAFLFAKESPFPDESLLNLHIYKD